MVTCVCCSLRVGLIIYSSICELFYILKLGYITFRLFFDTAYVDSHTQNLEQSIQMVKFTLTLFCILNCGLLLLGAASKNENILRPWLCFSFVILLTIFCNATFELYEADIESFSVSTVELLANGVGYSCVFCNFEELSNILSDEEDDYED